MHAPSDAAVMHHDADAAPIRARRSASRHQRRDRRASPRRRQHSARAETGDPTPVHGRPRRRRRGEARRTSSASNVTIGPNVVIGGDPPTAPTLFRAVRTRSTTTRSTSTRWRTRRRRSRSHVPIYSDVGFVRFDMVAVYPDGHADLTLTDGQRELPVSLAVALGAPDRCAGEPTGRASRATSKSPSVRRRSTSARATWIRPIRPASGRCAACRRARSRTVWDAAKQAGAKANTVAKVAFLEDGKWFFDNEYAGDGIVKSFADKCP